MPKKVSESQKKAILDAFINGNDINAISISYDFSPITISRQLKKLLSKNDFEEIKAKNLKLTKKNPENKLLENNDITKKEENKELFNNRSLEESKFEIIPIIQEIEITKQKDFTTQPLKETNLPDLVYMLIDKKIELTPKLLGDYPQWSYMSDDDLKRFTLEIFSDQKSAKKHCHKNQKLIKIPNPNVFLIASKILRLKGITRIIFDDLLLSL